MLTAQEQEWRDEAERLKLVPVATRRQVIAIHLVTANDAKVPKADRDHARARATALAKFLRMRLPGLPKRQVKPSPGKS